MTPYYDDGRHTIYHGDCLDVLAELEISVDAVVTDPPYASGTRLEAQKSASGAMLRAGRFADRPIDLDQMTTTGFVWLLRAVAYRCYRMLPEGGSFLSFIDWRQWPNLVGAVETCNLRVQGMIVWDKGSMGLGNGFRAQHELILHAAKGVPNINDKSCGNVIHAPRLAPVDHPSPKPASLVGRLIEVVTESDALVLDPFMGGGTTLVAANMVGRRSIGIEVNEAYCENAAQRLSQGAFDFGGAA